MTIKAIITKMKEKIKQWEQKETALDNWDDRHPILGAVITVGSAAFMIMVIVYLHMKGVL